MNALTQISTETAKRIPAPGTDYCIVASRFAGDGLERRIVLFEGQYYTVGKHLLPALYRGETPADLELEADEIDEDML